MNRRSKTRIMVDMLILIKKRGGKVIPTHILYGANLSYKRMKQYLSALLQNGFIEKLNEENRVYYKLTEKGQKFIKEFKKIEQISEAFGISF